MATGVCYGKSVVVSSKEIKSLLTVTTTSLKKRIPLAYGKSGFLEDMGPCPLKLPPSEAPQVQERPDVQRPILLIPARISISCGSKKAGKEKAPPPAYALTYRIIADNSSNRSNATRS